MEAARHAHIAISDVLSILSQSCADLLDIESCSMVVRNEIGEYRSTVASDNVAQLLDAFQLHQHEGPTWECLADGVDVLAGDLHSAAKADSKFANAASNASICAAHAVPLVAEGEVLGALTLYLRQPQPAAVYLSTAVAIAHGATKAIVLDAAVQRSDEVSMQLGKAINGRVWIEQAKGIVAEQLGITPEEAFATIRSHARRAQRKTSDVGQDLVTGLITVEELTAAAKMNPSRRSRRRVFTGSSRHQTT